MTITEAYDRARALRRLASLARESQITGARRAILRAADRLTASGLLGSEGRALVADAVWACKEAA